MMDVAKFLSYSRSVDNSKDSERIFSLKQVHSGHLFSCLHGDRRHWSFGREQDRKEMFPKIGKGS